MNHMNAINIVLILNLKRSDVHLSSRSLSPQDMVSRCPLIYNITNFRKSANMNHLCTGLFFSIYSGGGLSNTHNRCSLECVRFWFPYSQLGDIMPNIILYVFFQSNNTELPPSSLTENWGIATQMSFIIIRTYKTKPTRCHIEPTTTDPDTHTHSPTAAIEPVAFNHYRNRCHRSVKIREFIFCHSQDSLQSILEVMHKTADWLKLNYIWFLFAFLWKVLWHTRIRGSHPRRARGFATKSHGRLIKSNYITNYHINKHKTETFRIHLCTKRE